MESGDEGGPDGPKESFNLSSGNSFGGTKEKTQAAVVDALGGVAESVNSVLRNEAVQAFVNNGTWFLEKCGIMDTEAPVGGIAIGTALRCAALGSVLAAPLMLLQFRGVQRKALRNAHATMIGHVNNMLKRTGYEAVPDAQLKVRDVLKAGNLEKVEQLLMQQRAAQHPGETAAQQAAQTVVKSKKKKTLSLADISRMSKSDALTARARNEAAMNKVPKLITPGWKSFYRPNKQLLTAEEIARVIVLHSHEVMSAELRSTALKAAVYSQPAAWGVVLSGYAATCLLFNYHKEGAEGVWSRLSPVLTPTNRILKTYVWPSLWSVFETCVLPVMGFLKPISDGFASFFFKWLPRKWTWLLEEFTWIKGGFYGFIGMLGTGFRWVADGFMSLLDFTGVRPAWRKLGQWLTNHIASFLGIEDYSDIAGVLDHVDDLAAELDLSDSELERAASTPE